MRAPSEVGSSRYASPGVSTPLWATTEPCTLTHKSFNRFREVRVPALGYIITQPDPLGILAGWVLITGSEGNSQPQGGAWSGWSLEWVGPGGMGQIHPQEDALPNQYVV